MQAHYTAFYLKENRNIYNNKVKNEEEVEKKGEGGTPEEMHLWGI